MSPDSTQPGGSPATPPTSAEPSAAGRPPAQHVHDVLVVGGGPSGSSCAYWLADAGWDVALVEKKRFPREKTCGDGLTPRSVRQLADMGLEEVVADGGHRCDGLRANGFGQVLELPWPEHPSFPNYGYTITRHDLDQLVNDRAVKAGATVWQGTEAVSPLISDPSRAQPGRLPHVDGVVVKEKEDGRSREILARYVVVADGSNSRLGRALGTSRARSAPLGMALRGYYRSPRHDDRFIESHLDIRDGKGNVVPGYGWIFPLGDGRVNVGVGLLSTDQRWKGMNTSHLMDTFVRWAPASWDLRPETACGPATGGKLPMGLSVGPRSGPNVLVVGDAAGSINPFNGEGIAYGYETGRFAAAALGQALAEGDPAALAGYEERLDEAYGLYYRVGRVFVQAISRPELMKVCVGAGMHSESLMGWILRIMSNLLRPEEVGPAEAAYRALAMLTGFIPDR